MVKIIATDMDGTLLNSHSKVSQLNKETLLKAQEKGIHLILASGRPLSGLIHQVEVIGLNTENTSLLAFNGAIIIDAKTHEVHISDTLQLDLTKRLIKHLENFDVNIMITDGTNLHVSKLDGVNADHEAESNGLKLIHDDFSNLSVRPHKVLLSAEPEYLDSIIKDIEAPFIDEMDFVKSAPFYLECLIKNENKGKTLARFCEMEGVDLKDVIAFGDNFNDMQLIETAGIGVAMGNAVQPLKDIADIIADTNDNDGLAKILIDKGIV